jgi:hypothetical protein
MTLHLADAIQKQLAARIGRFVRLLPDDKLWAKPLPFENSVGHLVVHLTGSLNHFIGAKIAGSGYVRDRPGEFSNGNG